MIPSLDEKALRRADWQPGHRVKLGDGQEWTFPRPVLRFFPRMKDDGIGMAAAFWHDEEYAELRDKLVACDGDDMYGLMSIQLKIAAGLLLRNYTLDNRQLASLIYFDGGSPENIEMWEGLSDAILANPPKLSPDGSE